MTTETIDTIETPIKTPTTATNLHWLAAPVHSTIQQIVLLKTPVPIPQDPHVEKIGPPLGGAWRSGAHQ